MIYIELIIEFLKVGFFAIGGYSTMALAIDEMLKTGWMTKDEIIDMVAIAESTPGPIAVNIATYVGSMKAGIPGAIVATIAEIMPAFIIIILASFIIEKIINNKMVDEAFSIIRPSMTGLILAIGLIFILQHAFNIVDFFTLQNIKDSKKGIILFIVLYMITIVYKKIKTKEMNAINLILISAICGILINI